MNQRDVSQPLEQQIANLQDVVERIDIEMHNYQTRINQALKLLVERIEIYEQRNIDNQNNNSESQPTV